MAEALLSLKEGPQKAFHGGGVETKLSPFVEGIPGIEKRAHYDRLMKAGNQRRFISPGI
jgi:hypothetical protein